MEYENEDLEFQKAVEAIDKPNTDGDPITPPEQEMSNNKKTTSLSL
ncbi:MAG: hypothetical protein K2K56_12810 [Lachnospiraceae bacterium]|nr:hypothetical protein [Lachnospiraceae bacterium]